MKSLAPHRRNIALLISAAFGLGGVHWLTAGEPAPFVTAGEAEPLSQPVGEAFAGVDDTIRYVPTTRRAQPEPQKPPLSTEKNTDTNRPVDQWQRLTDDWGGLRPQLDDRGIAVALSATGDYGKVLKGGANTEDDDFVQTQRRNVLRELPGKRWDRRGREQRQHHGHHQYRRRQSIADFGDLV